MCIAHCNINRDEIPTSKLYRFLNRNLGMKVALQNGIYDMVMQELESAINRDERAGRYDMGIKGKSMLPFIQLN